MASCSPSYIMAPRSHASKIETRVFMLHNRQIQPHRTGGTVQIKPSIVSKVVFEDRMMGIVCYRDEKGEVICEGYDEGPRFCTKPSKHVHHKRKELHVHDSSLRRRHLIVEDVDFLCIQIGVSVQEED